MRLSSHYYVVSLSRERNALFEGFRDQLIEVQNMGFPVRPVTRIEGPMDGAEQNDRVLELAQMVDHRFGRYYLQEPLGLVVVGERDVRSAFAAVTEHRDGIIGHADGDYTTSNTHDLGKIAWAIVKDVMSGVSRKALHNLDTLSGEPGVASGLDAVVHRMRDGEEATLLVEEDYHVYGHLDTFGDTPAITGSVDVRDVIDDVIDIVVEKVLSSGGNVVFLPDGELGRYDRIVLITNKTESVR